MNAFKGNVLKNVNVSTLLSLYGKEGNLRLGASLHASIFKSLPILNSFGDQRDDELLVISNSLVSMYAKCGQVSDAEKVFEIMEDKDTISWNSVIWGFLAVQDFSRGIAFFNRMRESNFYQLDKATITTVLSFCTERHRIYVIKMMHSVVILSGFEHEVPVGNAVVTGYFKCGCPQSAMKMFEEMPMRNVVTWTAVVSALAQNSSCRESLSAFSKMRCWVDANALTYTSSLQACSGIQALVEGRQIHGLVFKSGFSSDIRVESALMNMYSKCDCMEAAIQIYEAAQKLDEVSMTVILTGLAQNGLVEEAIKLFIEIMNMGGAKIDPNMVSAVLGVFGVMTSLAFGKQVHSLVIKKQFLSNLFVSNGLINMYSKCGEFGESVKIFDRMDTRNSVSWNSIIAGYANHGHGYKALQLYEEMVLEGVEPTDITFLSLLQACSHVGSVEKGKQLLESMSEVHGFRPRMEHYACMVDLLGRAGYLHEAKKFIEGLPVEPTALVWQALLGACNIYGNSEIGIYAASQLLQLDPDCTAAYVLMANIYSYQGRWKERASFIRKMKELGVQKEAGVSWLEVENKVHSFVVRDRIHPKSKMIYEVLHCLYDHMAGAGHISEES